jgi:predicted dienelactone hydrolase
MRFPAVSLAAAAAAVAVLPLVGTPAAAATQPQATHLSLPRPTGPHAVGVDTLHLVDPSRPDPWVPESGHRQLMVSMYYPAVPGTGRPAPYMSTDEAQALLTFAELDGPLLSAGTLAGTTTWAHTSAGPLPGRYPLVVLSPGFSVPRTELTGLATDLASRGFVVADVDHAYESQATAFPGGGVLPCVACQDLNAGTVTHDEIAAWRARDLSFVIDELVGPHPAWSHARMIDAGRIGMGGHSIGGDATAATMAADRRVLAGVSLDGPFLPLVPTTGLDHRPFLMFGDADAEAPGVDPTWDASWPRLNGPKRWLTVAGADHYTFTDLDYLVDRSGALSIPGADRSIAMTRAYVGAFYTRYLKGVPQPLLDGPSRVYPEVTFQNP